MGPGQLSGRTAAGRTTAEEADDARLQAARDSFPGWEIVEVFGGYLAFPKGASIVQAIDLGGLVAKLRQQP